MGVAEISILTIKMAKHNFAAIILVVFVITVFCSVLLQEYKFYAGIIEGWIKKYKDFVKYSYLSLFS